MKREILSEEKIDESALNFIVHNHKGTIDDIKHSLVNHKIVVVGMAQNPVVKKARKILEENSLKYHYLSYGSYFSKWQLRLAIKLWSGWPTFPQVFIDGKLIGGASDLQKFLAKK